MYFDTIDVSEGIDASKTSELKYCIIFHYHYFLDQVFTFQLDVCNRFHDLRMMSVNLNDINILNICSVDYRYIINGISK